MRTWLMEEVPQDLNDKQLMLLMISMHNQAKEQ